MPLDDEIIEENPLEGEESTPDNSTNNPPTPSNPEVRNDESLVQDNIDSGSSAPPPEQTEPDTMPDSFPDNPVIPENGNSEPEQSEPEDIPEDESEIGSGNDSGGNSEPVVPDDDSPDNSGTSGNEGSAPEQTESEDIPEDEENEGDSKEESQEESEEKSDEDSEEELEVTEIIYYSESEPVEICTDLETFESSTIQVDLYQYTILNRLEFIQYALCIVIALLFLQIFVRYKK